jgi:hypothetical protein
VLCSLSTICHSPLLVSCFPATLSPATSALTGSPRGGSAVVNDQGSTFYLRLPVLRDVSRAVLRPVRRAVLAILGITNTPLSDEPFSLFLGLSANRVSISSCPFVYRSIDPVLADALKGTVASENNQGSITKLVRVCRGAACCAPDYDILGILSEFKRGPAAYVRKKTE